MRRRSRKKQQAGPPTGTDMYSARLKDMCVFLWIPTHPEQAMHASSSLLDLSRSQTEESEKTTTRDY